MGRYKEQPEKVNFQGKQDEKAEEYKIRSKKKPHNRKKSPFLSQKG